VDKEPIKRARHKGWRPRRGALALWKKDPLAVLAWFISFMAIVLAGIQWRSAELATERGQRAWLSVERVELGDLIPGDKPPVFTMAFFKNTGPTPALNVRPVMRVVVTDKPLDWALIGEGTVSNGVIGAGAVASSGLQAPTLTPMDMANLLAGTSRVYLYGVVKYEDVFGKRRETRFCFMNDKIHPEHGPLVDEKRSWAALSCEAGNENR